MAESHRTPGDPAPDGYRRRRSTYALPFAYHSLSEPVAGAMSVAYGSVLVLVSRSGRRVALMVRQWIRSARSWALGRMPAQWRHQGVADALAAFDSLPIEPQGRRYELRELVRMAAKKHWDHRMRFALRILLTPQMLLVTFPLTVIGAFGSGRWSSISLAGVSTFVAVLVRETALHRTLMAKIVFIGAALWALATWVMVFFSSSAEEGGVPAVPLVAVAFLVVVSAPVLGWQARRCRVNARDASHPHDELLVSVIRTAAAVHSGRAKWRSASSKRASGLALETLIVRARLCLAMTECVDPGDRALRQELRVEALRISASIREHKKTLATAASRDHVDEVVIRLINTAEAVAKLDRESLLANAPEAPSAVSRLRTTLARSLPGAVLIGAALLLPHLPLLAGHEAQANAVKWTLLPVGFVWIMSANADAGARVGDVLGRSLFPK